MKHYAKATMEKSLSGSGRKYLNHNFREQFDNDGWHLNPGDRYFDFDEKIWKTK